MKKFKVPEAKRFSAPKCKDTHTIEECDYMLGLPLDRDVYDAWLDERLSAMKAQEIAALDAQLVSD